MKKFFSFLFIFFFFYLSLLPLPENFIKGKDELKYLKKELEKKKYKELLLIFKNLKNNEAVVDSIIEEAFNASEKYDIDTEWIFLLAYTESGFDPKAKGKTGDYGLYQITKWAIIEYEKTTGIKIKNKFNIKENTEVAIWFLRQKLNESNNNFKDAFAKYNAGKFYKTIGYDYFKKVMLNKKIFLSRL